MDASSKTLATTPENRTPAARSETGTPFDTLRREVDRLFDDFLPFGWRRPLPRTAAFELAWPREEGWPLMPAIDMVERDGRYEVTAELPGLAQSDVEVKLFKGNLSIKGEKKEEREETGNERYVSERRYGSFQRMLRLPEDIDADKIAASFKNGVLTVTLPKSPASTKDEKTIVVNAG